MNLINQTQLAEALRMPKQFVTMMRRAGYRLKYEAAGRTTLEHALSALKRAPDFRASHYAAKGWERLPKVLAEKESPAATSRCASSLESIARPWAGSIARRRVASHS